MHNERNLHILGFAGSLRRQSYNRALLAAAQELLPANTSLEIFDLDHIPFFNSDVEAEGTPASVLAFRERIQAADALLIATPEYNASTTGVLKNAIDWASRRRPDPNAPLDHKPVAIVGAGGMFGTVRAQLHLREILLHNQMYVLNAPTLMLARAWEQFDDAGILTNPDSRERLRRLLHALRDWTLRLERGAQTGLATVSPPILTATS